MRNNRNKSDTLRVFGRILKDARPIAPWLIVCAVISLGAVALSLLSPRLLSNLCDQLYAFWEERVLLGNTNAALDGALFGKTSLWLTIAYVSAGVLSLLSMLVMNNVVSRHFTCAIRIRMSEKVMRLPISYLDRTPNGEIISRMTDDVSTLGTTLHSFFNILIEGFLKLIAITVLIFLLNPILAAVVVIFVPLSLWLSTKITAKSEAHFHEVRKQNGLLYALTEETFTGFDAVKAFQMEGTRRAEQEEICDRMKQERKRGFFYMNAVQPIVAFSNNVAYVLICILGGIFAAKGWFGIGVGTVVAFILYARMFAGPLESIAQGLSMMQDTLASADRVYRLMDEEEMKECNEETAPEGIGNIELSHVCFSYDPEKPLIRDLNIQVKAGQKVAIVGPTGGGKTTIVNLLMRFYELQGGRITVDGKDISKMPRSAARSVFSMVLQDTWLFGGTILENIAYGASEMDREAAHEAARRAHVDRFIRSLPNGYDTVINEESTNISGGQKQLLTIARAYYLNRPILILDEATSNVDTRTELLIQRTMDELMKGRTSFVIAHRLSTIVDADVILVVNNGEIVEQGTHEALLAQNGFYAEIYHSQYAIL